MSALPVQVLKKLSATLQQANLISSALGSEINRLRLINDKNAKDYLHIDIKEFSKREAAVYRSSHKQNISIEMLQEGYHKSFSEIFNLIEKRKCLREAGGPGSDIWLETPLEEQHDKLDQLQYFLTRAEAAQRTGRYEEVYRNQLSLAQFFKNSGDGWLSDHFFECCFNSAKHIKLDGGKKEAESHANLGLVREKHGQLEKAAEHYETFHHLTVGRIWKDETGRTQHTVACENLWRIYTLLADKMLENKEHKQAIRSLIKAFEMAKEGGDNKIKGESAYRLGLAYLSTGNPQSAISGSRPLRRLIEQDQVVPKEEDGAQKCCLPPLRRRAREKREQQRNSNNMRRGGNHHDVTLSTTPDFKQLDAVQQQAISLGEEVVVPSEEELQLTAAEKTMMDINT
ncbi:tetratricopeptide repeat protein 29 isoform X2 [Rhinatrema bivittatum]|uniref:tetratricopeptide repeat protein 29 isoform X2 n=1 Tax=Rhinatrema bivittatum TaxID=194408 RepID=UPI00112A1C93|nr:tetratricopeptide repeat protein 29 isoform X2 [Rhinatrema bivittatum]